MTVELTPCALEASEARLTNRVRASVDSATGAGSDARGEGAEGPCGEGEGRWWVVEVVVVLVGRHGVVMVACWEGLMGAGAGALVGRQCERGAGAGVRCSPTSRYGLGGRPEQETGGWQEISQTLVQIADRRFQLPISHASSRLRNDTNGLC